MCGALKPVAVVHTVARPCISQPEIPDTRCIRNLLCNIRRPECIAVLRGTTALRDRIADKRNLPPDLPVAADHLRKRNLPGIYIFPVIFAINRRQPRHLICRNRLAGYLPCPDEIVSLRHIEFHRITPECLLRHHCPLRSAVKSHGRLVHHSAFRFGSVSENGTFNLIGAAGLSDMRIPAVSPCRIHRIGKIEAVFILPCRLYRQISAVRHTLRRMHNLIITGRNEGVRDIFAEERCLLRSRRRAALCRILRSCVAASAQAAQHQRRRRKKNALFHPFNPSLPQISQDIS